MLFYWYIPINHIATSISPFSISAYICQNLFNFATPRKNNFRQSGQTTRTYGQWRRRIGLSLGRMKRMIQCFLEQKFGIVEMDPLLLTLSRVTWKKSDKSGISFAQRAGAPCRQMPLPLATFNSGLAAGGVPRSSQSTENNLHSWTTR